MNVRKLLVAALAMAALASTATLQAQDERKGRGRGGMPTVEERIERLETAVGSLSEEQKTKIKAIYAKTAEKMQNISREEGRAKMVEIMRATQKEIRAVLTAEQQEKFDSLPQGRGPGGGGKRKDR